MEDSVGKYQIEQQIGEGGFAKVYKAKHQELGVTRVVKVLKGDLGEDARQALLSEARKQANLSSDRIVAIMDFDTTDEGKPFIVMEYVEGETLRDRLRREKLLPIEMASKIALAVAEALAEAHSHDVVHHDIKPENVMITKDERVKVLDFGIARTIVDEGDTMSRILGTPAYMAPEQIDGKATMAADQWALGVMLVEMITGKRPFEGPTQTSVIHKIATEGPVIDEEPFAGKEPLLLAVKRALSKDPSDRFMNMKEFAEALQEYAGTVIVRTIEVASWRKVAAAVLLTLLAVGGVAYARNSDLLSGMLSTISGSEASVEPAVLPLSVVNLSEAEKMERAGQYLNENKGHEAYTLYTNVSETTVAPERKEEADLMRAGILVQDLDRPLTARSVYANVSKRSPESPWAQTALMRKAEVELDMGYWDHAARTLEELLAKYPNSPHSMEAASLAERCRSVAEEEQKAKTQENLKQVIQGSVLPNNYIALIALFSSVGGPLIWLLIGFHGSEEKTRLLKTSRKLWLMIVLFLSLLVVNCLSNNYQSAQNTAELMNFLQSVSKLGAM